ncbi:MAG: hypothetical protein OCD76_17770 [Reichenbachiella sp.]
MSEISLEELMNMTVTVASTEALTTRESPGVVSLLTTLKKWVPEI